jgi:hypothetical protein
MKGKKYTIICLAVTVAFLLAGTAVSVRREIDVNFLF